MLAFVAIAADLPDKGKEAPDVTTLRGPGGYPDDPGAPIGSGFLVLLSLSFAYILIKKKKE